MQELSSKILSDIVVYSKYAKFIPAQGRRESWQEIVARNKAMHVKRYPALKDEIETAYSFVLSKRVLPSMRSLQFAGKPIELNEARGYNCSYLPMEHPLAFSEIMFLLLSGCGVGYSVQKHHVKKLPPVIIPSKERKYVIGDSIVGWADAVKVLMKSYFTGKPRPVFDFSDIRPKGTPLKTSGGIAPGPEPLKDCLHNIQKVLDRKKTGDNLRPIEVHDICCFIADAVLAGGIRRAAMIALFSFDDEDMLTCKYGNWYETNPQRARANNSAVILRHRVDKADFMDLWKKIQASGSGEPGFLFSNNKEQGTNPCGEVSLRPYQFCNLTTINVADVKTQDELNERAKIAAFLGTLQAGYTEFHYLRDIWKETTEKEALIGVSMTGIASSKVMKLDLTAAAELIKEENARVAKAIGINKAARCTLIKPEGTASLVVGSSSGVHAWHNKHYIRRMRLLKNEPIYLYLAKVVPDLIEDDFFKPTKEAVISVPQKAPEGAIVRSESALDLLERVAKIYKAWIKPGHRRGDNTNNVSCTVSVKPEEWDEVGEWMWRNRENYTAITVLPYDGGSYQQAPFEDCTEAEYEKLVKLLHEIDLTQVYESNYNNELTDSVACGGGACEIR